MNTGNSVDNYIYLKKTNDSNCSYVPFIYFYSTNEKIIEIFYLYPFFYIFKECIIHWTVQNQKVTLLIRTYVFTVQVPGSNIMMTKQKSWMMDPSHFVWTD